MTHSGSFDQLGLVGSSPAMQRVRHALREVAPHDIPVLLVGPTGSGKELAARALHVLSGRHGTFVPLNMASIAPDLAEALLFGHQRGAFTGATHDSTGAFRSADGGTLFLDEINSTRLGIQGALLRTLDGGLVRPLGSDREHRVDSRVVAASNQDLDRACQRGEFRLDLLHRLRGALIRLPALAERRSDIPEVAAYLLHDLSPESQLAPCAAAALRDAEWPGNVRQLRAELRLAVLRAPTGVVRAEHVLDVRRQHSDGEFVGSDGRHTALIEALRATAGRVAEAARQLGRSRATIYRWCKDAGVNPRDFRPPMRTSPPAARSLSLVRAGMDDAASLPLAM